MKKIARRCAIVLIGVAIVIIIGLILNNKVRSDGKDTSADIVYAEEMTNALTTEEILDLAEGSKENSEPDVDHDEPIDDSESEPISKKPVNLSDIYTEPNREICFQRYDPDAISYYWEYYDLTENVWKEVDHSQILNIEDELYRKVSCVKMQAISDINERMVRCITEFQNGETDTQTAYLYVLQGKVKSISTDPYMVDGNDYMSTWQVPVVVNYEDGKKETITGLSGLYFLSTNENTDYTVTVSGNRVETTTIVMTECNYAYIGLEEKQLQLRYHPFDEKSTETALRVEGIDRQAPVIIAVNVSPFEISNVDKDTLLTVSIEAEDDQTPYPYLEYAFVFEDQQPLEDDWTRKASFDINVSRNGKYIAYVRDQSGNISHQDQQLITVDTKAPVIVSTELKNKEGFCKSNTIHVEATDSSEIYYRYLCNEEGMDSEWVTYNEYVVEKNGMWTVQVKDAAGNLSETEIMVNNIDQKAPVIRNIKVK